VRIDEPARVDEPAARVVADADRRDAPRADDVAVDEPFLAERAVRAATPRREADALFADFADFAGLADFAVLPRPAVAVDRRAAPCASAAARAAADGRGRGMLVVE
jgi:hypothetical protein